MLYGEKSREDLNVYLEKIFSKYATASERRELYQNLLKKFGMRISAAEEMVTFKKDIREYTTFEVFCVLYFVNRNALSKFFTSEEIETLSKQKFDTDVDIQKLLVFNNMIELSSDQWVGKISAKRLMEMKKARLINYEEGEQRALKMVKYGSVEVWKPFVNRKAVEEIKDTLRNGTYIPDFLTLNMPEGSEYNFDNGILTVESLPNNMFNLDDGYHRYIAISQLCDFDEEFDYPMGLQIVNFSPDKANRFIYQKDQKTQMKKIVSATYNTDSVANRVCNKLNEDSSSNIQGMIGRNKANINQGSLSILIDYFFVKKTEIENKTRLVISLKKSLENKFNALTEQDDRFFGEYTDEMIFSCIFVFSKENINQNQYATIINKLLKSMTDADKKLLNVSSYGKVRRKGITMLENKLKEVI